MWHTGCLAGAQRRKPSLQPCGVMPDAAPISVLVVESNAGLREAIARDLEARGCWVTLASGVGSGLEAVRRQLFDVVVSDAFALYEPALRARPELRGRFIMITVKPRPTPEGMSVFIDSEQLLLKPLSVAELWRRISAIVERTRRPAAGHVAPPAEGAPHSGAAPDLPKSESATPPS